MGVDRTTLRLGSLEQAAGTNTISAIFHGAENFTGAISGGQLTLDNQVNLFDGTTSFSVSTGGTLAVTGSALGDANITLSGGLLELTAHIGYQMGKLESVFFGPNVGRDHSFLRYHLHDGGQYEVVLDALFTQAAGLRCTLPAARRSPCKGQAAA